jgi:hypothetical protein
LDYTYSPRQIAAVSECLTAEHNKCTGRYIDSTCSYLVKCGCYCHDSGHNQDQDTIGDRME